MSRAWRISRSHCCTARRASDSESECLVDKMLHALVQRALVRTQQCDAAVTEYTLRATWLCNAGSARAAEGHHEEDVRVLLPGSSVGQRPVHLLERQA